VVEDHADARALGERGDALGEVLRLVVDARGGAELFASAYVDPGSGRTVAVLVNRGTVEREIRMAGAPSRTSKVYRTTNEPGVSMKLVGSMRPGQPIVMPARSLATVVFDR